MGVFMRQFLNYVLLVLAMQACGLFLATANANERVYANLDKASAKYSVDKRLVRAIASVESQNGLYKLNATSLDYGLMQINYKTAAAYGLDSTRLYTDDAYNADAGVRVLYDLKRRFKGKEQLWACRYNVGTGKLAGNRLQACLKYIQKLQGAGYVLPALQQNDNLNVAGN